MSVWVCVSAHVCARVCIVSVHQCECVGVCERTCVCVCVNS